MLPLLQPVMKCHKLISDASLEIWLSSSDFTERFILHTVQETTMCKPSGRHMFQPGLDADSHLSRCSSLAGRIQSPLLKSSVKDSSLPPSLLIWYLHFYFHCPHPRANGNHVAHNLQQTPNKSACLSSLPSLPTPFFLMFLIPLSTRLVSSSPSPTFL